MISHWKVSDNFQKGCWSTLFIRLFIVSTKVVHAAASYLRLGDKVDAKGGRIVSQVYCDYFQSKQVILRITIFKAINYSYQKLLRCSVQ